MKVRSRTIRGFLVAAGVLGVLISRTGEAAPAEDGDRFRDWTVKCRTPEQGGGRRCVLVQVLQRKTEERTLRIMSALVGQFGPDFQPGMLITVPLGVYLPAGLVLKIDGNEATERLDFQFCNRTGCRAIVLFDGRLLGLFKAGLEASVSIRDHRRREVTMPISLKGFSKGVAGIGIP